MFLIFYFAISCSQKVSAAASASISNVTNINLRVVPSPTTGATISSATRISISVSDASDYTLAVNTDNTDLVGSAENISSISSNLSLDNFPFNSWGRCFSSAICGNSDIYSAISTTNTILTYKPLLAQSGTATDIYYLTYGMRVDSTISADRYVNTQTISLVANDIYEKTFSYNNGVQTWAVPYTGKYKIELWGAEGGSYAGNLGGKGGYTSGEITLTADTNLYLYVGGKGINAGVGYNGGGSGVTASGYNNRFGGGGATDIRLVSGTWDNFDSLKSRIMVAAGGGGYAPYGTRTDLWMSGGGLSGNNGGTTPSGGGATQTGGGGRYCSSYGCSGYGTFGRGGNGSSHASGGGGGYYGGGGGARSNPYDGNGGGGSSFISGHDGCDAIAESSIVSNIVHTGQANHYSGYIFANTVMVGGDGYNWTDAKGPLTNMPTRDGASTMIGNSGNGYAKITYLGQS